MGFFTKKDKGKEGGYPLQWVGSQLAVGPAPQPCQMEELKESGLDAILNLGLELEPLAEFEREEGFEVMHVPLVDEEAPDLEELERILEWLDESIYLGKKVLIHCRFGVGRTGTLLYSYLLRRGWGQKRTKKLIKRLRSQPANAEQARLLRRYGKQEGTLSVREPSLEPENFMDLTPYFSELEKYREEMESHLTVNDQCGREHDNCCYDLVEVCLVEAVYLLRLMNRKLDSEDRKICIQKAVQAGSRVKELKEEHRDDRKLAIAYARENIKCPFNKEEKCLLFTQRPLACRLSDQEGAGREKIENLQNKLEALSDGLIQEFSEGEVEKFEPDIYLPEVISGRFVQRFFQVLAGL